jgi:hypothetical protein
MCITIAVLPALPKPLVTTTTTCWTPLGTEAALRLTGMETLNRFRVYNALHAAAVQALPEAGKVHMSICMVLRSIRAAGVAGQKLALRCRSWRGPYSIALPKHKCLVASEHHHHMLGLNLGPMRVRRPFGASAGMIAPDTQKDKEQL